MLNRSAVVLRPRKPFLDWLRGLEGPTILPRPEDPPTLYLVPPFDDEEEAAEVLSRVFPGLFEEELNAWWTDPDGWPPRRTFVVFRQWFDIGLYPMVEDVASGPIEDEDA
jgi:hypothetical protein